MLVMQVWPRRLEIEGQAEQQGRPAKSHRPRGAQVTGIRHQKGKGLSNCRRLNREATSGIQHPWPGKNQ